MKFIDAGGVEFACPVTFSGGVTPELSLGNIDSLDISGNVVAGGNGQFGGDLTVGDDLTVTDRTTIGGSLTVSGNLTVSAGSLTVSSGALNAYGGLTVSGASAFNDPVQMVATLEVAGESNLAAVTCAAVAASGNVTVATDKFTVAASTGNTAVAGTLAVAGASALHNTQVIGTLSVSSTSTLAATSATAITASSSLTVTGANIVGLHEHVSVDVASLVGASAGVYGIPCPVAGTVTAIRSRLKGALATGDATLTSKIGNSAITNGVITITQSGSAAGDIDSCSPSAANTVAVGDNLTVTAGGTNDAAAGATVVFTIRRSA